MKILTKNNFIIKLLLGVFISVLFALILLTFFSVIITFTGVSQKGLSVINTIIRLLSVGLCVLICVKEKAILKGSIAGLVTCIFVQLLFFAISGTINIGEFIINSIFCIIFGVIFAIIFVNLKNKS